MSGRQEINYRKSGFLLGGIVAAIYTVLFFRGKHLPYLAVAAAVLAVLALFETGPLRYAIKLFIGLGNCMHRFTNPLIFGLIYVVAVIPTALVLKLSRKDVLQLHYDSRTTSYWKEHNNGKDWKESFRNQY